MIFCGLLFEKMETADNTGCLIEHFGNADAVPQLPERCLSRKAGIVRYCLSFFVNVKPILFSLPYVVSIAKQAAQPRAAVFGAGGVPKAFLNRDIKAAPTAVLCTFPP